MPRLQNENSRLTRKRIKDDILSVMEDRPEVTLKEIAEELGLNQNTIKYYIHVLRKSGMVERIGTSQKGRWSVK